MLKHTEYKMIKVWDYLDEYKIHRKEFLNEIDSVFKSSTLVFGPKLAEFEKKFTKFVGTKFGLGVGNGTDALYIALRALDIGHGDEVILHQILQFQLLQQ